MTFKRTEDVRKLLRVGVSMSKVLAVYKDQGLGKSTLYKIMNNTRVLKGRADSKKAGIEKRRKVVNMLALKTKKKDGKVYIAHSSLPALREQLLLKEINVCEATIRNDLAALGFTNYVRNTVPTLDNDLARAEFKEHVQKKKISASDIIFSDEHFVSVNCHGIRTQWAKEKKKVLSRQKKDRRNIATFQVWGAVGVGYKSDLVFFPRSDVDDCGQIKGWRLNGDRYVRRCLSTIGKHMRRTKKLLMQDGASCHRAKTTMNYLTRPKLEVKLLEKWPPSSPDLNPIETVWAMLNHKIREAMPNTAEELKAWKDISQAHIDKTCNKFNALVADLKGKDEIRSKK
jgi:DDE superfamily endonuclease